MVGGERRSYLHDVMYYVTRFETLARSLREGEVRDKVFNATREVRRLVVSASEEQLEDWSWQLERCERVLGEHAKGELGLSQDAAEKLADCIRFAVVDYEGPSTAEEN